MLFELKEEKVRFDSGNLPLRKIKRIESL